MANEDVDGDKEGGEAKTMVTRRQALAATGALLGGVLLADGAAAQPSDPHTGGDGRTPATQLLAGKVAVITGAARGIGRAIAVDMAKSGADVVGIDICARILPVQTYPVTTAADLEETSRLVKAHGRKFMSVVGDVRDMSFLRGCADRVERELGHVDIVVANAATQLYKPLVEMEDWEWRDVIDNNLNGTANTLRAFAPRLIKRKSGRIIVVASMQGRHGSQNMASYSASKWGIIGLMKSAALELGKHKITVNALLPGLVATPLTMNEGRLTTLVGELEAKEQPPKKVSAQEAAKLRAPHVPLKVPWLQPQDIAPAATFLASDLAAMVTGACYDVTGGDDAHNLG